METLDVFVIVDYSVLVPCSVLIVMIAKCPELFQKRAIKFQSKNDQIIFWTALEGYDHGKKCTEKNSNPFMTLT